MNALRDIFWKTFIAEVQMPKHATFQSQVTSIHNFIKENCYKVINYFYIASIFSSFKCLRPFMMIEKYNN